MQCEYLLQQWSASCRYHQIDALAQLRAVSLLDECRVREHAALHVLVRLQQMHDRLRTVAIANRLNAGESLGDQRCNSCFGNLDGIRHRILLQPCLNAHDKQRRQRS
jgi:hypothetical protein